MDVPPALLRRVGHGIDPRRCLFIHPDVHVESAFRLGVSVADEAKRQIYLKFIEISFKFH